MPMMQVRTYESFADLDEVEDLWNRLGREGLFFTPSFSELKSQLRAERSKFRLVVAQQNSVAQALACFIYQDTKKFYHVGGKKLFSLPARVASLHGSCVIGRADERIVENLFNVILKER